ncbi:MAG: hypothetical protein A2142_05805 [candidate division Zixibacteria bacterium RBG_16_48_11]|nr:MAG: hypothetical protein A2142_05805 [candidate division Zixibacteria bacterium RBG_16_48_11]
MGLCFKKASDVRTCLSARTFGIALLIISGISAMDGCSKSRNRLQTDWEVKSDSILSSLASSPQLQEGYTAYKKYGCILCHGLNGEKGIKNANAQTGEEIPALTYVAEGYTQDELKQQIWKGLLDIPKKDSLGQTPPYRMPSWKGVMDDKELELLAVYLMSLMPKGEQEEW